MKVRGFLGFLRVRLEPRFDRVTTYLVEAYVAQLNDTRVRALASEATAAALAMTCEGVPVRHVHSIFIPEDDVCFHLLEAPSAEAVREACARAGLTFERIVETLGPRVATGPDEKGVLS